MFLCLSSDFMIYGIIYSHNMRCQERKMSLEVNAVTKDFGATLRALRTARGWSQKALAQRINRSANTIWRYESNLQEPTLDTLRSFSAIFGVPLSFWENEEEDESLTESQKGLLTLLRNNLLHLEEFNDEQKALCYMELQKRLLKEFSNDQ